MSYEKISEYYQNLSAATRRREMWQRLMDDNFNRLNAKGCLDYWTAEENRWRAELDRFTVVERDPATKTIGAPGLNIGLGVCITRGYKFLISRRLEACKIGVGAWAMPGGAFEHAESIEACMIRETKEETGLDIVPYRDAIGNSPVFHVQENDREGMKIITLYTHAHCKDPDAEPINPEPHKHTPWEWKMLAEVAQAGHGDNSWIPVGVFYRNFDRLFCSEK